MHVAACADLFRDVANFQRMRRGLAIGDEAADAGDADQHAFVRQLPQGAVGGHARYAELPHNFVFGGHACRGAPPPRIDIGTDVLLHLQVQRLHRQVGLGHCGLARWVRRV